MPWLSAVPVPFALRAGLFPAKMMRRHLCPATIYSMSCFGVHFSYRRIAYSYQGYSWLQRNGFHAFRTKWEIWGEVEGWDNQDLEGGET